MSKLTAPNKSFEERIADAKETVRFERAEPDHRDTTSDDRELAMALRRLGFKLPRARTSRAREMVNKFYGVK